MRICHITPHLPPDQAANALLPFHLGRWAVESGHDVRYVAHPPRSGQPTVQPAAVAWVRSRHGQAAWLKATRIAAVGEAWQIVRRAGPGIAASDVVHIHSNGLLAELAAVLAGIRDRPVVVTLYGTEIWHYRRKRLDLFTRMMKRARGVTFYSRLLMERAREQGLGRPGLRVVYPPVADEFQRQDGAAQAALRRSLGIAERHLLVNVKRLHPLAGQRTLVEAMPAVLRAHPDTRLVICGTGPLRVDLESLAQALGVAGQITFAGLVENWLVARYCAAADLFVLPSRLEACPTVAVEALASGTPVVSTDNPGGLELHQLFGDDVEVVPRQDAARLAATLAARLSAKRRTHATTAEVIDREFRPAVVWRRFLQTYEDALTAGRALGQTGSG
jgi:glycosyltransferase involved in cell wall biosynthesis